MHVDRDDCSAKFWLDPVALSRQRGFVAKELRAIERIVKTHRLQLLEAWHELFGP